MKNIDLPVELAGGSDPHDVMARECLVARLRMLNRVVTGFYDEALRPLGVKVSQTNVLTAVAKNQPVSPGVLSEILQIEKSTLSRNVERLRAKGWLRVLPGEDDRSHLLEVTAKGRKLLKQALPLWRQGQERAQDLLGRQTVEALNGTANRMWAKSLSGE